MSPAPAGTVGAAAVVRAAGLSYRQIDHWSRAGLIHPLPRKESEGTGTNRWFAHAELERVVVMAALVRAGIRPSLASPLARTACENASPMFGVAYLDLGPGLRLQVALPDVSVIDGVVEVEW